MVSRRGGVVSAAARAVAGQIVDIIIPRRCGLCGSFGGFLCERCVAALPRLDVAACPYCARQAARATGSSTCHHGWDAAPAGLDSLIAACRFDAGARALVHRLKYERLSALAAPMGALLAERCAALACRVDVIVPVPLHPRRARQRGFNQAALLARAVSGASGTTTDPAMLRRTRATPPQVRTAGAAARAANVAGAFTCAGDPRARTVLLIDDVATTGATLSACAAPLRAAGAAAVHAAVFARDV